MTRLIEWDGIPFAVLVEGETGSCLVPPVVLDDNGKVVQGREVLELVVGTDLGQEMVPPVLDDARPALEREA